MQRLKEFTDSQYKKCSRGSVGLKKNDTTWKHGSTQKNKEYWGSGLTSREPVSQPQGPEFNSLSPSTAKKLCQIIRIRAVSMVITQPIDEKNSLSNCTLTMFKVPHLYLNLIVFGEWGW
jgi:hypothetical protein